jgi:hypothetical protein
MDGVLGRNHIIHSACSLLEKYGAFILNRGSTGSGKKDHAPRIGREIVFLPQVIS